MQKLLRQWPACLLACAVILGLQYHYRTSDCEGLRWILAPAVRLAGILGGIDFTYMAGYGYVNHTYRFVVGPPCAGIRFLTIATGMSVFAFVHRMDSRKQGIVWTLSVSAAACGYTVLVNSLRILLSIRLPLILAPCVSDSGWLTADRLHTMIGTGVYFLSLLILYRLAESAAERLVRKGGTRGGIRRQAVPVCWYVSAVLVLPFLKRAVAGDLSGSAGYVWTVLSVCGAVLAVRRLLFCLRSMGPDTKKNH